MIIDHQGDANLQDFAINLYFNVLLTIYLSKTMKQFNVFVADASRFCVGLLIKVDMFYPNQRIQLQRALGLRNGSFNAV